MSASRRGQRWLEAGLLLAILGVAFWLRWLYVRDVSPYVDEYITLRAARQILDRGLPLLPTGNFYSHGLILSYVEAGVMALTGFNPLAARLPVLLVSLLAVLLTWWVGRRWFSSPVGLLAATLLALTPDAIIWGGRARMYTPLQLFVLLALFFYWRGLAQGGSRRDLIVFTLCFLGALFHQAEAMVLLPVLGVVALGAAWPTLRRDGPGAELRHWWRTGLIAAWIVAALGVLTELWFRRLGPPMVSYLGAGVYGPSARVYVQPTWDWPGIRKTLEPFYTSPAILGLVGLLVAGLVYRLVRRERRDRPLLPAGWWAPLVYLFAITALTLAVLLFVADPSWKSPRYLFMLLPAIFLALAAGLVGLVGEAPERRRWQWVVLGGALVLVVAGSWPAAWAAAHENVAAYDDAFAYVADQWLPGDAVMAFVPQASIFYLGKCDYLSVPTDFRGFAYAELRAESDGRWLEGWDGIPLVDSAAGVAEALAAHRRLWFVVDEHRFHTRFAPGFTQAVWAGMDLAWRDGQVMVFRTADPPPPTEFQSQQVDFGPISLVGYALEATPQPGADLPLTLYWQADEEPPAVYSAFVHLVDAGGSGWAQDDGPPLGEVYPTDHWWPGEILRDRRSVPLPADLGDGLYRLDAGLYDPVTMAHLIAPDGSDRVTLGFMRVGSPEPLPPGLTPLDAVFGEQIRLVGYEVVPSGPRAWTLTLAWAAEAPVEHDYTVFVHLVNDSGEIRGQDDAPPGGGFYPTSFWTPGETVVDRHSLSLPADAPAGTYRLRVGLYRPETGERLPTAAGDFVELETWSIP
jgi:4-amino-4-deoxy-L-arabinose transferase-like glycosyltransferase